MNSNIYRKLLALVLLLLLLLPSAALQAQEGSTITLVTHDSFDISEEVLAQFEEETGITVEILFAGDAGTMVNQAVLSRENPLGDVIFGVDNTFLGQALEADIFLPYESPLLESVDDAFRVDAEHRVTPIDYGDVCINYDIAYFEENNLPLPESLADLTEDTYQDLLVVENPATSSPGLAFLMATIDRFGEEGDYSYLDYWAGLVDNGVLVVEDWTNAYYGEFTLAGGDRPLVVSYASSPPAEVLFAEETPESAPTASIVAPGTCFRQIEFAGILRGTENEAAAQQLIDFMLSLPFQEDLPLRMFVFPVNTEAELPELFQEHAQLPEEPVEMSYESIHEGREEWIEAWTETVLR